MLNLFRNNHFSVFVSLLIYTVLLRGMVLLNATEPTIHENFTIAGSVFSGFVLNLPFSLLQIIDILLIFLSAIFLNRILILNDFFESHSAIPGFIYITLNSLFNSWNIYSSNSVASLLLLLSIYFLFAINSRELVRQNILFSSFSLALACFLCPSYGIFFFIILLGIIGRTYQIRDFLLLITGFILPFYFAGIWYFSNERLHFYLEMLFSGFKTDYRYNISFNLIQWILSGLLTLLLLLGYFKWLRCPEYKVIKIRGMFNLLFAWLLLVIVAIPILPAEQFDTIKLTIIPCTLLISKLYEKSSKNRIISWLFYTLLLAIFLEKFNNLAFLSLP